MLWLLRRKKYVFVVTRLPPMREGYATDTNEIVGVFIKEQDASAEVARIGDHAFYDKHELR